MCFHVFPTLLWVLQCSHTWICTNIHDVRVSQPSWSIIRRQVLTIRMTNEIQNSWSRVPSSPFTQWIPCSWWQNYSRNCIVNYSMYCNFKKRKYMNILCFGEVCCSVSHQTLTFLLLLMSIDLYRNEVSCRGRLLSFFRCESLRSPLLRSNSEIKLRALLAAAFSSFPCNSMYTMHINAHRMNHSQTADTL